MSDMQRTIELVMHTARMKRIICKDGVSLSVQANENAYCNPRDNSGQYDEVEVGFITDANDNPFTPPESWRDYADGAYPNDVYAYVPVQVVEDFIAEHGGRKFYTTIHFRF